MKIGHPKFTLFGLLICGYLALSQSRGWLLFSSLGSKHANPGGGPALLHK
jgi:hypothetical protein